MAISVDYSTVTPWLITIPKSDLTLISGTRYQLTVDEFWILLRDYTDNESPIAQPKLYFRIPATSSTPSITTINDTYYSLEFEDGLYSVNIINGNTNIREVEVKNQVSVNTNNTTGFIDPVFLQVSTFAGKEGLGVTISSTGTDSILYPNGIRETPVKTEQNIIDLTASKGFRNIYVKDNISLVSDHSTGRVFWGDNPQTVNIDCGVGSNVANCKFQDAYVTGKLDSGNILWESIIGSMTNVNGFVYKCTLIGPLVISDNTNVEDCFIANTAPSQECTIDFNNLAKTVIIGDWSAGRIRVKNMVTGSFIGMSGTGGRLVIDIANTGGTAVHAGSILVDDTYKANIDLLTDSSSAGAVWENPNALSLQTWIGLHE